MPRSADLGRQSGGTGDGGAAYHQWADPSVSSYIASPRAHLRHELADAPLRRDWSRGKFHVKPSDAAKSNEGSTSGTQNMAACWSWFTNSRASFSSSRSGRRSPSPSHSLSCLGLLLVLVNFFQGPGRLAQFCTRDLVNEVRAEHTDGDLAFMGTELVEQPRALVA